MRGLRRSTRASYTRVAAVAIVAVAAVQCNTFDPAPEQGGDAPLVPLFPNPFVEEPGLTTQFPQPVAPTPPPVVTALPVPPTATTLPVATSGGLSSETSTASVESSAVTSEPANGGETFVAPPTLNSDVGSDGTGGGTGETNVATSTNGDSATSPDAGVGDSGGHSDSTERSDSAGAGDPTERSDAGVVTGVVVTATEDGAGARVDAGG